MQLKLLTNHKSEEESGRCCDLVVPHLFGESDNNRLRDCWVLFRRCETREGVAYKIEPGDGFMIQC